MSQPTPANRATLVSTALLALLVWGAPVVRAQIPEKPEAQKPAATPKPGATKPAAAKPEPFKNLQVFPKDIGHDELVGIMRGWARGTGMGCDDCHAEDPKTHEHDFASDELEHKKIARQMLKMVIAINKEYIGALPAHHDEAHKVVTCYSCHRGQEEPPTDLTTMITAIASEKGAAAGLTRYQELRKDHLNDGRYDFSDRSLLIVASNLADAKKADDAVTILRADLEIYPSSSNVHALLGRTLAEKGDLAGAEASLKKAIELDPKNERAKRALAALYQAKEAPKPQ